MGIITAKPIHVNNRITDYMTFFQQNIKNLCEDSEVCLFKASTKK